MLRSAFLLSILITQALQAQTANEPAEQEFTLHAASELVVLNASVQDSRGVNVHSLKAENFKVYEDGRPQVIKQFSAEDRPISVGLIVDSSGSMRTKQAEVATAALSFIRASNPDDEVFIVTFNDRALLGLPPELSFSNDPQQLRRALLGRKPEGRTALNDAVVLATDHLATGKWENKALLLISDGGDNSSVHTLAETLRAVEMAGVTVYTVALFDPDEGEHNIGMLRHLSKMTGGENFAPMELSEIRPLCLRIAADIRASYTIAYTPPHPEQNTVPRTIKVVATGPDGAKLAVRARTRYILSAR